MKTIGKLAKDAGVGVETVRFYERKGLLKQPKSSRGSYRTYEDEDAKRIRFIKRAQELGFTLKEVIELLELNATPKATCEDLRVRTVAKLSEIDQKIKDLKKMKTSLKKIEDACAKSPKAVSCCRIADCFEGNC